MRILLDSSPIGVAIVSPGTTTRLFVNKSLAKMFGASSPEDLLALPIADSWADQNQFQIVQKIMKAEESLVDFEAERLRQDGSSWWALMNSQLVDFEGQPARAVWHNDITETVAARSIIQRSKEDLERRIDERTRAMQISQDRLRHISEVASDWFWEMGPDLRFTYFSERVMDVVGVPPSFHIGKTREELAGEDATTEKWQNHLQDLKQRRPFRNFQYDRKGPDGTIQVLTASGKPVFDEAGKFKGYIGVGTDVTKQIENANLAKRADERLAAAIQAFAEPFALWGPDDRLIIGNQSFQRANSQLGKRARPGVLYEDFAQAVVEGGLVPQAVGREAEWLQERLDLHRQPRGSFEQQRQDGSWYLIYEQRFADGSTVTISTDITRLKNTQARLKESQERFRDFADVAAEWYWEQDENLRFINVSAENVGITGIPAETLIGKTRWEIDLRDVSDEIMEAHKKQLEAREPFYNFRAARLRPDNNKIYISMSGKPIFDEQGQFMGYRGAGRDITDIVEAQMAIVEERDRAEKANRAKSEFLANMSHELRTPLNSILGYSQIIKDELVGKVANQKYVEYAEDIFSSGQHLLMVISDILDISKVEAGEINVEETEIEVGATIEAAILIVELLGKSKQQDITVSVAPDLPMLLADDRIVRQILINLLSNAIKFTPEKGQISVQAKVTPQRTILIRVRDNGIGIAPENIKKALEPFGQVRSAPELAHEGTGLGLSLSKSLMELHDGYLTIESAVKKGTTVTLEFPKSRILT